MSQRLKLFLYLGLLHAILLALLVWQREVLKAWLIVGEVALVGSFILGIYFLNVAFKPMDATLKLRDIVNSREFSSRYPSVGQKEVDSVLDAYNQMLAGLQREWMRLGEH